LTSARLAEPGGVTDLCQDRRGGRRRHSGDGGQRRADAEHVKLRGHLVFDLAEVMAGDPQVLQRPSRAAQQAPPLRSHPVRTGQRFEQRRGDAAGQPPAAEAGQFPAHQAGELLQSQRPQTAGVGPAPVSDHR